MRVRGAGHVLPTLPSLFMMGAIGVGGGRLCTPHPSMTPTQPTGLRWAPSHPLPLVPQPRVNYMYAMAVTLSYRT